MSRTALVAGATGLVGGHLLPLLLADDDYAQVVALGRREAPLRAPKLTSLIAAFDRLETLRDFPRADDVFCCLGTTIKRAGSQAAFRRVDHDYVVSLARAAHRAGARQFLLVSAVGADPASRVFYSRVKGEVEDAIRQLPYQGVHIFRPSFLLGDRAEFRMGERVAMPLAGLLAPLMLGPLRRYRPVPAAAVARAMVRTARAAPRGPNVYEYDGIVAASSASPSSGRSS